MKRPHFALPEIYDDSLSYYDVLRKLIKSIHVISDNLNKIPEQIANEAKARLLGDQNLQQNINTEVSAREQADQEIREGVSDKISELKGDLGEISEKFYSKNIFDETKLLDCPNWTVTDGVYSGNAEGITYYLNNNYPIEFEENTQYTLSFTAKTDANETTEANGLVFIFKYTDGTEDDIYALNSYTTFTEVSFTTDAEKTISEMHITRERSGLNNWWLKNVQIEKGTQKTDYTPFSVTLGAVDITARKINEQNTTSIEEHLKAINPHGINKNNIGLGLATTSESGLMSPTDKQKLDSMIGGGTITIEGSGITKNASAFGFLPTNDAETNSIALQNALNGGGTILVDLEGVYKVCKTTYIDSNTTLIFGANVFLKRDVNESGVTARYPFINRGAFDGTGNENITIIGLHLITNGHGAGEDIANSIIGQRGQVAFYHVKHLRIEDFEIVDGTVQYYNIHIQDFDDIHLENIRITSEKDGIHLGSGKNFVIKHCFFKTNDDAIAMNGHDYPTGTSCLGWIENGIIEDIHFLSAPEFGVSRGIYMLGGSWSEWASGNSYRTYGDACVSNGRIYRTTGEVVSSPFSFKTSTVKPTFESGTQTLSDGLTWTMVQDYNVGYDAGVRNVVIRDIFFDRTSSAVITMNTDNDQFSRSYYPNSNPPVFENITLENVVVSDKCSDVFADIYVPTKNFKIRNCVYNATQFFARYLNQEMPVSIAELLLDGTYFELYQTGETANTGNTRLVWNRSASPIKLKIANSMGNYSDFTCSKIGEVNILANDIGIN